MTVRYRNNKMTKKEFIHAMLLLTILFGVYYNNYLFLPVNGWTTRKTYILYIMITTICIIAGTAITFTRWRSVSECFQTVSFPGMLFFVIARVSYGASWTKIVYTFLLVFLIVYCTVRIIRDDTSLHALRQDVFIMVAVLFLSLLIINPQNALHKSDLDGMYRQRQNTMSANLDELAKYAALEDLTIPEREKLVEKTATIMRNELGYPYNPKICYDRLAEGVLGQYHAIKNSITIDLSLLEGDDGFALFRTVCHECYHVYQRSLLEAYEEVPENYRQLLAFNHCDDYLMENLMPKSEYANKYWEVETERMARLCEYRMENELMELLDEQSQEKV